MSVKTKGTMFATEYSGYVEAERRQVERLQRAARVRAARENKSWSEIPRDDLEDGPNGQLVDRRTGDRYRRSMGEYFHNGDIAWNGSPVSFFVGEHRDGGKVVVPLDSVRTATKRTRR